MARRMCLVVVLSFSMLSSGCAVAVAPRISSEEERQAQTALLTEAEAWQKKQEMRIRMVAARLIKAAENQSPLTFKFVAKPEDSAGRIHPDLVWAGTDGRTVWITRGMMRFLKNNNKLAIVLAHEMAHAYRGHAASRTAKQVLRLALGPAAPIGMLLVNAATSEFDKDKEREADLYGLIWAYKAGFNVAVAKELLERRPYRCPRASSRAFSLDTRHLLRGS